MTEDEYFHLAGLIQGDHDRLLIKLHRELCEELGDDLLNFQFEADSSPQLLVQKKLEYQGARKLHARFERELSRINEKTKTG